MPPSLRIAAGARPFQVGSPYLKPVSVVLADKLTVTSRGGGAYRSTSGAANLKKMLLFEKSKCVRLTFCEAG